MEEKGVRNKEEEFSASRQRRQRNEDIGVKKGRGTIVVGLMAIKGLSATGAQTLLDERERSGEYKSLEDFSRRVRLNRDDIIALCPAGVFDSISAGLPRQMQARFLLGTGTGSRVQGLGFGDCYSNNVASPYTLYPEPHTLLSEYEALGFLRQAHPLVLWEKQLKNIKRIRANLIQNYQGQRVCLIGMPIAQKEVWTKDGLTMSFLSFEDETALYETVIFPDIYDKYQKFLFDQNPLLIYGRVVNDLGALILEIEKVSPIK